MKPRSLHLLSAAACVWLAGAAHAVTVRYMLWDSSQVPAYRQCAADFQKQHPDITVRIRQAGWDDYWTALAMGFIADSAPDVFVNHLSRYPEFVHNALLLDLAPLMARDRLDAKAFPPTLLQAWSLGAHRYGLPKDWDTVALAVNMAHARQQGVTEQELQGMDWNPKDGGRFEQVVRKLTVDRQGRNGLAADFDRRQVAVYGYQQAGAGGMSGQTEWSHFAVSNGFSFQSAPWSLPLHYDSPRLAETLEYLAGLPAKGLSAAPERIRGQGASALFLSGKAAMVSEGSWMIHHLQRHARFAYAWVPLPKGPTGQRASMLNGTADSIWVGSRVKEQAWQWVQYLASAECQRTVASHGIVFPAMTGMTEQVLQAHRQMGVDTSAFLTMSQAHTFLPPIAGNASRINDLVGHAIEAILLGKASAADALKKANDPLKPRP